jgi:predicted TIM-barrel fold metal-dependent hydrolase
MMSTTRIYYRKISAAKWREDFLSLSRIVSQSHRPGQQGIPTTGYHIAVILDFHCHITTPGSQLPVAEGNYYRTLAPVTPASHLLGHWTQDAVDVIGERLRTPTALRTYRRFGPLIYTEMSRRMVEAEASVLLAEMAETGVSQAVVVAIDPFVPTDEVLDACHRLPDILLPFGSCDPNTNDYAERFQQLLTKPIVGLKFHSDLQQMPLDSPRLRVMLSQLAESEKAHLLVYLHTGNFPIYRPLETPWHVALPHLLAEFPTLTFVCGHSGWDAPRAALKAALAYPNLFLETSWQPPHLIRRLCDKLGPERLLFGSDYPFFSQRRALRNARAALTEAEFELVGSGNARRLLRL